MKPDRIAALVASVVLIIVVVLIQNYRRPERPASTGPARSEAPRIETGAPDARSRGGPGSNIAFRSRTALEEHFQKHGREFGNVTMEQYLQAAQALRDAPVSGSIIELKRGDGVTTRFDRSSGAFLAFNRDRTIRTFFKPNDGEAYFRRQAARESEP